jgi:CRP-like cAMP-binding protein
MTGSIVSDHRELFSGLDDELTEEEGAALSNAFRESEAPVNSVVHRQGDQNNALFFVNEGKLRIGITSGTKRIFVKILFPGDIFGSETFFSNSYCTATIIAFVPTTLYRLDKDDFRPLKAKYPGLENKLKNYCHKVGTVTSHVQQKQMTRRAEKREPVSGNAVARFLSNSGNLVGKPIIVGLSDISRGGTCFVIRLSNEEKTDLILGRKLIIKYSLNADSPPVKVAMEGTIVAITPKEFSDYYFHMKFDKDLTAHDYSTILSVFSKDD